MIKSLIDQINEVKKLTADRMNIPLTYILFLLVCFLMWKPEYVSMINIFSWLPTNIGKIILTTSYLVYTNLIPILITLLILLFIIILITGYTPIFQKILPNEVEYTNDTTVCWNEYSAIRRLLSIIKNLASTFFVYYLSINVLANPYNFVENFFIDGFFQGDFFQSQNTLIESSYLSKYTLVLMNLFFWLNIIYTIYLIIKALFEIKIPTDKYSLSSNDLILFTKINSFSEKNSSGEQFETIIFKQNYRKKPIFFLARVKLTNQEFKKNLYSDDYSWVTDEIPPAKRSYHILDKSENLADIVYFFESLKDDSSN